MVLRWQETLARAGRETQLGGDLQVTYHTFIADTEEKAIAEARPYFEEHMKFFGPLGFLGAEPGADRHTGRSPSSSGRNRPSYP